MKKECVNNKENENRAKPKKKIERKTETKRTRFERKSDAENGNNNNNNNSNNNNNNNNSEDDDDEDENKKTRNKPRGKKKETKKNGKMKKKKKMNLEKKTNNFLAGNAFGPRRTHFPRTAGPFFFLRENFDYRVLFVLPGFYRVSFDLVRSRVSSSVFLLTILFGSIGFCFSAPMEDFSSSSKLGKTR